jgi:hypothetical protein
MTTFLLISFLNIKNNFIWKAFWKWYIERKTLILKQLFGLVLDRIFNIWKNKKDIYPKIFDFNYEDFYEQCKTMRRYDKDVDHLSEATRLKRMH